MLYTPPSTLYTSHFSLDSPHSTLHSPHSELFTWHSTLYILHCTLHTPHSTLYTPYTPHSTLYTSHCTLYAPHSTLYNPHSELYTFTLYTLHFTFTPSQLYTFHTWPCMEPWPSFIFMLRTHTYLSSSTSALHCVTSSHASKGPRRCRRWTFPSSPITSHHVGYAQFPSPCRAPVHHNHMFSSSSPPTYIASIRRFGCSPCQHVPASDPLVHVDEKTAQLRGALCVFMPRSLPS